MALNCGGPPERFGLVAATAPPSLLTTLLHTSPLHFTALITSSGTFDSRVVLHEQQALHPRRLAFPVEMPATERPLTYDDVLQWLLKSEAAEQHGAGQGSSHRTTESASLPIPSSTSDDDSSSPSPSSSTQRITRDAKKVRLKHGKALLCISRAEGHQPLSSLLSLSPTSALYIHGAGASCGLKYDDVFSAFSSFGPIVSLTMVGFLPFVLVQYRDTASAIECRRAHHRRKQPGVCDGRLLYVEYAIAAASTLLADSPALLLPNASSMQRPDVKGLVVLEEYVSEEEEEALLGYLHAQPWLEHRFRSVQHYGYHFDYERNDVFHDHRGQRTTEDDTDHADGDGDDDLRVFPPLLRPLIRRFRDLPSLPALSDHRPPDCSESMFVPDQLTVNRYQPGDGIPAHVDVHSSFTHFVLSLSLGASICMDITPFPEVPGGDAELPFPLLLPRRSLLVLGHYARYGCQHAIQPRKTDRVDGRLVERQERVSLTFRRRRVGGECHCQWPLLCDTASGVRKKDKKFVPYDKRKSQEEEKEAGHQQAGQCETDTGGDGTG